MLLFDLQLFAHKKGVSSTKNGRDSNAQRLGTKMHAGQIGKTERHTSASGSECSDRQG